MYRPKGKKIREGWKGSFIDSYFENLENGEWVEIGFFKYWYLKFKNFRVRIRYE